MSDDNTNPQQAQPSQPTHIAYKVSEGGTSGYWIRIGAAWPHKDGKGFNIKLECLPVDGRISLRLTSEQD